MAQVKLFTTGKDGQPVPLACPQCGEQREGAVLNLVTRVVLSCVGCGFKEDRGKEHEEKPDSQDSL